MSADAFKGKKWENLSSDTIMGIKLHRWMDEWIDQLDSCKSIAKLFERKLGRYKNVAVDMLLDHYLAKLLIEESSIVPYHKNLQKAFELNQQALSPQQKELTTFIFQYEWLLNYGNLDGLTKILRQMNRRIKFRSDLTAMVTVYLENKTEINTVLETIHTSAKHTFLHDFEKVLIKMQ